MAALKSRYRRGGRWWMIGTTLALATAFMVFFVAASGANLSPSTFESTDGNLVVNTAGNTDWANAPLRTRQDDLASGTSDNAFGQGTKEDNAAVTVVTGSIPPNKSDLTRFYTSHEKSGTDTYLYLAWERSNVLGSANMDFELNQAPTANFTQTTTGPVTISRTAGDLLVTYDFTNGGSNPVLGLLTWVTTGATGQCFSSNALPCWGNRVDLSAAGVADGSINTVTVTDPIATASLPAGTFGEAAIDLSRALPSVFGGSPTTCESFGSAFLKSRSSASFTAEVKDFVAPQPISVSNCGTLTIHKVTENGDATFGFTTTGGLRTSSAANATSTFSLSNGGTQSLVSAGQVGVLPGSSSVTESTLPSGWSLKSLVCTTNGTGTSASTSGATVSVTMAPSGVVDCTYTNHTNVTPTIATTLSAGTISAGSSVHDSASLTGATGNAGGTVTYTVYTDNACSAGARAAGTMTVTNGSVPDSNALTFNSAGDFYWQAVYSGDANNNGATSACTSEHLLVKTNPSIATTLSDTTISVGGSVHDSASLTGKTTNAGGTVTYTVYTDNACSAGARDAGTMTVTNGSVPDSNPLTFSTAGDFYWQAVYSGDANNNGATSPCTSEHLLVKASPSISTTLSKNPANIGDAVHDSASLTGATGNAGGTVTYTVYTDNACSAGARAAGTVNVTNGSVPDSNALTFNSAGDFYWQAVYSGDANNNGATSPCTSEHLVVNKNKPGTSTAQNLIPNDSATLTGATSNAGGTYTLSLFGPADATCSGTPALTQTVAVSGNGTYSTTNTTFIASSDGTWRWLVTYSGDSNNESSTSACGVEHFTITNS